jgi:hypothetical protein
MKKIGELINLEKENSFEQEQRLQRLFRKKAEEGDAGFAIAYALTLVADQINGAAFEHSRVADATEESLFND